MLQDIMCLVVMTDIRYFLQVSVLCNMLCYEYTLVSVSYMYKKGKECDKIVLNTMRSHNS